MLDMKSTKKSIDVKLKDWFCNDMSKALLRHIKLASGQLRGLTPFDLVINFPIIAIAGKNGSGKSTILALAACAYHNEKTGYRRKKRKNTYYTFSDFFVQHTSEISPEGIDILYGIAYDNWKQTKEFPEGTGIGYQIRQKKHGGKWSDYASRLRRNVIFLGIDRIVPHAERSQSRSYSRVFKESSKKGWEEEVKNIVGHILGKKYNSFSYLEHSKYNLPIVEVNGIKYTGFNMGAGENALFEIFSALYDCGEGTLLVIDEIELGLHAEAQRRFMEKLKESCLELHAQVISTTHSKDIFDCLPKEARFLAESINDRTIILEGISPTYAFSKMSGIGGQELEILVEDDVAKIIITMALPAELRARVSIKDIGSATCLARGLAAIYLRNKNHAVLTIFDGDQQSKEKNNIDYASNMCETTDADFVKWFSDKIAYLPGTDWPEKWLIKKGLEIPEKIALLVKSNRDVVIDSLNKGLDAGKHNEIHVAGRQFGLDKDTFLQIISNVVIQSFPDQFEDIREKIAKKLT